MTYEEEKKAAVASIASKLANMQEIYEEIINISRNYDLNVNHVFTAPEGFREGHNAYQSHIHWSASGAHC